jgi:lysophospholipase L1-like esterase
MKRPVWLLKSYFPMAAFGKTGFTPRADTIILCMMRKPCLLLLLCMSNPGLAADNPAWIGTWATNPTGLPTVAKLGTFTLPVPTALEGTVRYRLRISAGGEQIRLRFSNEYGDKPLTIRAATVGLAADGLDAAKGSLATVTFGDKAAITLPPGAPAVSDAIPLRVTALADLIVSVSVDRLPVNFCPGGMPVSDQAAIEKSDATREEHLATAKCTFLTRPVVSAVNVLSAGRNGVVVAFGDSITDGTVNPETGDRGWPGVLSRRLKDAGVSVVNAGISGNRLLESMPMFGAPALSRFDRDVLAVPGATHVVVLEGINDIGTSGPGGMFGDSPLVNPQDLIGAYLQIIMRAHEQGLKVIGATILPFEGAMYFSAEKETVRMAVNDWIRTSGKFDGIVDFDAAVRDPGNHGRMRAELDSGDHLHPNAEGHQVMGNLVDLAFFK